MQNNRPRGEGGGGGGGGMVPAPLGVVEGGRPIEEAQEEGEDEKPLHGLEAQPPAQSPVGFKQRVLILYREENNC